MTLPTFKKGIYPFFDASRFMDPGLGLIDDNVVGSLSSQSHVDGVGLSLYGSDIWQNQSDGQAEAITYYTNLLSQIDLHATAAGRSALPIWIRVVPAVPPAWLIASLTPPGSITHLRDTALNIDWVGLPTASLALKQFYAPYPHTTAYQGYVRNLRDWTAAALAAIDPSSTRFPVLHWVGPFMQSKQMGVPGPIRALSTWLTDGTADTVWKTGAFAGDSINNAWTYPKHLAAFQTFGTEMATGFANRWWFFTITGNLTLTSDQQTQLTTLKNSHPNGTHAVIPKNEGFTVGVVNQTTGLFNSLFRQGYRANIGGSGSGANQWFVANQDPHSWEAFTPFTFINDAGLSGGYQASLTPKSDGTPGTAFDFSEWLQNMFFTTFSADWRGACSDRIGSVWSFEPFSGDTQASTLANYPAWAQALHDARLLIRGTLPETAVRAGGRWARVTT